MTFNYSNELRPPQRMPLIDPERPAMAGMLRMLKANHSKLTNAFSAPNGLSCRKTNVLSEDGSEAALFVIEPGSDIRPLPGILLIHGGAFYLPLTVSDLELACEYTKALGCRVFLPEYRLVPAYRAPKALEDCEAVWDLMCSLPEVDSEKLLIAGSSAGGALAAGLCIRLRDRKKRLPKGQMLFYPVLDNRPQLYGSYQKYKDAAWPALSNQTMWNSYLKDSPEDLTGTLVPALCQDLSGLPCAYIEPQEIDILFDEALAYASALQSAGVQTEVNVVYGSYHAFDQDLGSPLVKRVVEHRLQTAEKMLSGKGIL